MKKIVKNKDIPSNFLNRTDSIALNKYIKSLNNERYRTLTKQEEQELLEFFYKDEEWAKTKLVEHNLRFVVSVAKQYLNKYITLLDLINEGNVGLITAVKKFKPGMGAEKFISYAVWWIKQAISKYIYDYSALVRLPNNKHNIISKINKVDKILQQQHQVDVTSEEIYENLVKFDSDITLDIVNDSLNLNRSNTCILSLDQSIDDDNDNTLQDLIIDDSYTDIEQNIISKDTQEYLKKTIEKLPRIEQSAVIHYFGLFGNHTNTYDGVAFQLYKENLTEKLYSGENIRKIILAKAILRLQKMRDKNLKQYLDSF